MNNFYNHELINTLRFNIVTSSSPMLPYDIMKDAYERLELLKDAFLLGLLNDDKESLWDAITRLEKDKTWLKFIPPYNEVHIDLNFFANL